MNKDERIESKKDDEKNDKENYYLEIINYYKKIKDMILNGSLLDDEQSCEVLVERIIEDMKKKDIEVFLLSDQRCSKIFELMLSINILCIKRLIDTVKLNNNINNEFSNDINYTRLENCIKNYIFILTTILKEIEHNIFDLYGSHVTETALESAIILISFLNKKNILKEDEIKIKELVIESINKLNNNIGWLSIITNSTASHVARTIINICIGKVNMCIDNMEEYILDNVGRRNQANKLKFNGKGQNKYKYYKCETIIDFKNLLLNQNNNESSTISSQIIQALKNDFEGIINDTYALPSLIVLCKTLFEYLLIDKNYNNIINHILTILITNGQEIEDDFIIGYKNGIITFEKLSRLFINLTENSINSNLKSRLLEVILEIIPYEILQVWINTQIISNNNNNQQILLNKLLDSEYGHYILLNLLKSNRLKSEEFILILKNLDFFKLITRKEYIDILILLIDTCRRLQCQYKYLTKNLWKAIEIQNSEEYQYTFSCIIFLSKKSLFINNQPLNHDLKISSQGCLMISSLSKFPTDTIHPLISGITYFINNYKNKMFKDILESSYGVRMVETILSSSSNIPQPLKKRWIQTYTGQFLKLTLSGICNYAIIAMFYASDHFYRKLIIDELLNEEQGGGKNVILNKNFKIFKTLKIESFQKKDNWYNINNKIDKTRKLFSNIIDEKINILQDDQEEYNQEKISILKKINENNNNNNNNIYVENNNMHVNNGIINNIDVNHNHNHNHNNIQNNNNNKKRKINHSNDIINEKSIDTIIQHIKKNKKKN